MILSVNKWHEFNILPEKLHRYGYIYSVWVRRCSNCHKEKMFYYKGEWESSLDITTCDPPLTLMKVLEARL